MDNAAKIRWITRALVMSAGALAAQADQWSAPAGFYDSATGSGATLQDQLYTRMLTGHIQQPYGNFRFSAAIHDADPAIPGNILLVYDRASVPATWDLGATWDREHVWPQSLQPGSASNTSTGNLGDPHALRPSTPSVNGARSNQPFGFEDTTGPYSDLGSYWYPGDADRGDIARCLFYSDTRWGPTLGITLVDTFPSGNQMGDKSSLIAWHYLDPPDEFERRRNHTIYSQTHNPSYYTNNRNAYVDRPEFVWSVYVDQLNDSTLFVGPGANPDGSSSTTVVVAPVIVGSPSPQVTSVTLSRAGFDGVYYGVSVTGEGFSTGDGAFHAFPIGVSGLDSAALTVGIDSATMSLAGMKTGLVVIDNLDVTTGAGPGMGGQDGDDVISIELAVLDHAEASLEGAANIDSLVYDFGQIAHNDGPGSVEVLIYNLEGAPGFTADLDVVVDMASGDTAALALIEPALTGIAAGGSGALNVAIDDSAAGVYSAIYALRTFDDLAIAGSAEGTALTIELIVEILAPACPADLTGDGTVDGADLAALLAQWGGPGSADLSGDGAVNGADLAMMLAVWGSCD